jgi:PAS domain S-box-containing protein
MRFRALAHSALDAIISADDQGKIIFWNAAAGRMFGYSEAEVMGHSLTFLMPPHYRQLHEAGMVRYQETGTPHVIGQTVELHGQRKNGEVFPLELSLSSWLISGKAYVTGILRDISERKAAEDLLRAYAKELEERNHELDAYNRTIAHDLKAPLSQISVYAGLISMKFADQVPPKVLDYVNYMEAASRQMAGMIDQLLVLATVRDASAHLGPVALSLAAQHALNRFKAQIEQAGIQVSLQPHMPSVLAQPVWLEEVFANLIGNAIKYRGQNNPAPRIMISAQTRPEGVYVEVADNGLGVPEAAQATLFEMFSRAHTGEAQGFGLGLSIVHRIIGRLNGQVGVKSQVGQGSQFWFILPALPSEESPAAF